MKGRKQSWVTKIFLLLTLPYLVTVFVNGPEAVAVNKTTDMENILPIILSEQISPEYRIETLEAQAVIARSNLMRKLQEQADTGSILCEISNNIKQKGWVWKIPEKCYETAVKNTQGQILTVDGELKLVPYHEISAGETRDGEEAFHDSQYAYLKSVDSSADKDAAEYLSSTYVSEQQLPKELAISSRDKRGYVQSLTADDIRRNCVCIRDGNCIAGIFHAEAGWQNTLFKQRKRAWAWFFSIWRGCACKRGKNMAGNFTYLFSIDGN